MTATFWNGKFASARRCRVVVGEADSPRKWYAGLEGTEREAVEVRHPTEGTVFYIDNEDGSGWGKITWGKGSPAYGHRSLPVARIVKFHPRTRGV
jgi:hypothetical protein